MGIHPDMHMLLDFPKINPAVGVIFPLASHRFEIKSDISEIGWTASAAAASYSEREIPERLKLMIWICILRLLQKVEIRRYHTSESELCQVL